MLLKLAEKAKFPKKKTAIQILYKCVHEDALSIDGKLPHGHMKSFVELNKQTWSWITRDVMNATYWRFKEKLKKEEDATNKGSEKPPDQVMMTLKGANSSSIPDLSGDPSGDVTNTCCYSQNLDSISRSKGGRPMGSIKEKKRIESEEVMNAKNFVDHSKDERCHKQSEAKQQ